MKRLLFLVTGVFCFTLLTAQTGTNQVKKGPPDINSISLRENSRDQKMILRDNMHHKLVLQRKQFIMKRNQMMMHRKMQMQKRRKQMNQNKMRQKRIQQLMLQRRKRMHQ
jgi:hypothetical protein